MKSHTRTRPNYEMYNAHCTAAQYDKITNGYYPNAKLINWFVTRPAKATRWTGRKTAARNGK